MTWMICKQVELLPNDHIAPLPGQLSLSYSSTATRREYAAGPTALQCEVIDREVELESWTAFFGFF